MMQAATDLQSQLDALANAGPERVVRLVDQILRDAIRRSASDVHLEPTHRSVEIRYRLDGVLQPLATLSRELAPNLVARLKVLAELLTYRLDIPQEGSIRQHQTDYGVDMRVSTFPTVHGEKVVVRIFQDAAQALDLDQLGLPADLHESLIQLLRQRTGAIFLTGPSGSGKTTTIYACLRHLVRAEAGGRHIVTIEDPVEQVIEGISQAQARPGTDFDFARGLRSLLRQDPEVIMIGEVRDRETAATAIEAALTGHLVISTLHAGSACGVVSRLLEMGIEPYLLTSGLQGILNQRLVRRLCPDCSAAPSRGRQPPASRGRQPPASRGHQPPEHQPPEHQPPEHPPCTTCAGTGYRGRVLLAELLRLDAPLRQAILDRADTAALEAAAYRAARQTIWSAAAKAVADGLTTPVEIERVLGPLPSLSESAPRES